MRWNLLLLIVFPLFFSACASKRHASRDQPGRVYPGDRDQNRDAASSRGDDRNTAGRNARAPSGSSDTEEYIRRYSSLAISEMQRSGIPASITLAQGILESGNGNSRLARQANNHFGIKCTSDWKGGKTYKDDDRRNECFRVYRSAQDSYRDHTEFLKRQRYRFLFDLKPTDYKAWAHGLKKAGYATNPRYPQLLISLIERYELYYFDRPPAKSREKVIVRREVKPHQDPVKEASAETYPATETNPAIEPELRAETNLPVQREVTAESAAGTAESDAGTAKPAATTTLTTHYYYTVKKGDTLYAISKRFNVTVDELKTWNRLSSNSISSGQQLRVSR